MATPSVIANPTLRWAIGGRLALAGAIIALANALDWTWLRWLSSELALQFASWRGFDVQRTAVDTVGWNGHVYAYSVSCTFVDLALAMVVMVWRGALRLRDNLLRAGLAIAAVLLLTQMKNAAQFIAIDAGYGWNDVRIIGNMLAYSLAVSWALFRLEDDIAGPGAAPA